MDRNNEGDSPLLNEDDLVLRALRALPPLHPRHPHNDARVRARATACFLENADRHRRLARQIANRVARKMARLARPILPLSIAGLALGYLIWAFRTAAMFLH